MAALKQGEAKGCPFCALQLGRELLRGVGSKRPNKLYAKQCVQAAVAGGAFGAKEYLTSAFL